MAKASSDSLRESTMEQIISSTATISKDLPSEVVHRVLGFLSQIGVSSVLPDCYDTKYFLSDVVSSVLQPLSIEPGRLTCLLTVKPVVGNYFGTLHGGAFAAVTEALSIACARTVVAEDKELFLGEQSFTYLSGAPIHAEVIADAHVLRSGKNLTIIGIECKLKKTQRLIYTARATFYHMPVAKL